MNTLLKELCMIKGISGREKSVRDYILAEISPYCECRVDPLGNIIALRKGKKEAKSRVMIAAHMDEVGFMVSYICENGLLRISPVGGIDPAVIYGKTLKVGKNAIVGVAGAKPVHMLDSDEKKKEVKPDDIYVDIGAENKEEAEKLVPLGDCVTFDSDYISFGDGMIKAPAIDDRAGCAIMIELIKDEPEYDTYFVFTVQEEVGTRGAAAAVFSVKPDKAIIVETTTAADINGVSDEKRVCALGAGAVVSYMDRGTVYDRELYKTAFRLAEKKGIKCQTKTMVAGGNDSAAVHVGAGGVKTIAVSLPCRYLHSPSCVIKEEDYESAKALVRALSEEMSAC